MPIEQLVSPPAQLHTLECWWPGDTFLNLNSATGMPIWYSRGGPIAASTDLKVAWSDISDPGTANVRNQDMLEGVINTRRVPPNSPTVGADWQATYNRGMTWSTSGPTSPFAAGLALPVVERSLYVQALYRWKLAAGVTGINSPVIFVGFMAQSLGTWGQSAENNPLRGGIGATFGIGGRGTGVGNPHALVMRGNQFTMDVELVGFDFDVWHTFEFLCVTRSGNREGSVVISVDGTEVMTAPVDEVNGVRPNPVALSTNGAAYYSFGHGVGGAETTDPPDVQGRMGPTYMRHSRFLPNGVELRT